MHLWHGKWKHKGSKGEENALTVLERRKAIIKVLNVRRYEKIANLMSEFGVCRRTIVTDINEISRVYPIYTSQGARGGIYVVEGATLLVEKRLNEKKTSCCKGCQKIWKGKMLRLCNRFY